MRSKEEELRVVTRKGFPVVVSAPSGAGKTSLCRAVVSRCQDLVYSVSVTSRPRRENEEQGRDYYFISRREFEKKIEDGEFLEWTEYQGSLYGTLRPQLEKALEQGSAVLLALDIAGARRLKSIFSDCVTVYILAPSLQDLEDRLKKRGRDSRQEIESRMASALQEMENIRDYDFALVNADFQESVDKLCCIIEAEKCRVARRTGAYQ